MTRSESVPVSAMFRDDRARGIVAPETRMALGFATTRRPRRPFSLLPSRKREKREQIEPELDRDRYSECGHCGIVIAVVAPSQNQ